MTLIKRGQCRLSGTVAKGVTPNGCCSRGTCSAELPNAGTQPDGTRKWPVVSDPGMGRDAISRSNDANGNGWLQHQFAWEYLPSDVDLAYWMAWIDIQAKHRRGPRLSDEPWNDDTG